MTNEKPKKSRFRADSASFWITIIALVLFVVVITGRNHSNITSFVGSSLIPEENLILTPWQASKPSVSGLYLAARLASENGDEKIAVENLEQAIAQEPNNMTLLSVAFNNALAAGEMEKALSFSNNIRRLMTEENKRAFKQASSGEKITSEEMEESEEFASGFIRADFSMVYMLSAIEAIKKGDLEQADKIMQEAAENGQTPSPLKRLVLEFTKAWLDFASKGTDAGLVSLDKFEQFGDIRPFLKFHGAMMLAANGELEKSESYYKDALEGLSVPPRRVAELYANTLNFNNKPDSAKNVLDNFWKHNRDIWLEKEELESEVLNKNLIVDDYKAGVAELFYGASSLVRQEGENGLAYQFLNMAIYLQPDLDIAKMLKAAYFEHQKRYDDAIEIYKKIDKGSPLYKRAQMELAQTEVQKDINSSKAISVLRALHSEYPGSPLPLLHEGDILRQRDKFAEAAEAYSAAIDKITEVRDYHWPVFYMRGICYERSKQWNKAEPDFKKALDLSPENPEVLNYLAYSWLDMGSNIEEAKNMLEKAVRLRPDEGHIIDSMGWAFYKRGEYEEALPYLENAIELMPADVTINDHLGDLYWQLNRKLEARFQWQRALNNNPTEEEKAKIEKKLKEGL